MTNLVPGAYRGVAVADVDGELDASALAAHFVGREAYRRSRWVVVRSGADCALIAVHREDHQSLFAPITRIEVLARPDETVALRRPDLDTGVPSQLARAAREAPAARCVVVHGRYGHISFILDPSPVPIRIVEVVPPVPAKLADQAQRILDVSEDLPPILLHEQRLALEDLAPDGGAILLPCQGAEIDLPGRDVSYLDRHPEHRAWTLVGCARSKQIHAWFYGQDPAATVDVCPRHLPVDGPGPVLTKCCLLESEIHVEPGRAVVPWGASLAQIGDALGALAAQVEPAWAPS